VKVGFDYYNYATHIYFWLPVQQKLFTSFTIQTLYGINKSFFSKA